MSIKVKCPSCGAKLKAPDAAAGRPLDCPHCAQVVPVPPPAAAPPPAVAGPGESSEVEGHTPRPARPPASDRAEMFEQVAHEYEDRLAHRGEEAAAADAAEADLPGAIGLGLGAVAVACLVLGCFTCGLTYWAAAPVAVAGAGCAAFSRSRLRAVGLAVNLLALVPAVIAFRAAWLATGGPDPAPQPFVR